MPDDLRRLTKVLQTELSYQMPRATYENWVNRLLITGTDSACVTIAVPSQQAYEWLSHRLCSLFEKALARFLEREVDVKFVVME